LLINRLWVGDVVEGFQVVAAATANMTVQVKPGSGRITTGTYPASYGYLISHDTSANESVTIATANSSPRIDYIVAYVDKAVAGSTVANNVNNTNNVLKFASVAGTPAGSPSVPTMSQIQAAIGAANPYIILAQIAVGNGVTQITNANITDKRVFVSPSSGVVLPAGQLSNPYKFSVYTTTSPSTGAGGTIKVPFSAKTFDTNNNFDTTNNRYVVPLSGYYQINIQVGIGSAGTGGSSEALFYVNGAYKKSSQRLAGSGDARTLPRHAISSLEYLNAGDYLEVFAFCSESRDVVIGANVTFFNGFLVSRT
jgi:hypothetical protein